MAISVPRAKGPQGDEGLKSAYVDLCFPNFKNDKDRLIDWEARDL